LQGQPNIRLCAPSRAAEPEFGGLSKDDIVEPHDAEIVEGQTFDVFDVPVTGESKFTHFLDGAQRQWRAGYVGFFPMRFAHTSAALLKRSDGVIASPSAETYSFRFELLAPLGYIDPQLAEAEKYRIHPVEASEEESPFALQLRMIETIEKDRAEQESELAAGFSDGILLIDGGIGEVLGTIDDCTVVGLVKTHQRQYFRSAERRAKVLGLKAGQRTSVFVRAASHKQGEKAFSFYLKLRDGANEPPMFGLARIEMPATQKYLEMADEIAGWVLYERAPLSLPDPRFHVLPYPIHLVEEHLKARQPSEAAIRGLIGI
jgi:hypothetical protein